MKWKVTYKVGNVKMVGSRELTFYAHDFMSAAAAVRGVISLMDADGYDDHEVTDQVTILGVVQL